MKGPSLDERQQIQFTWEGATNNSTSIARRGGPPVAYNYFRDPLTKFSRHEENSNWVIRIISLAYLSDLSAPFSCSLMFSNESQTDVKAFIRIFDGKEYVKTGDISAVVPAGQTRKLTLEDILLSEASKYFQVRVNGTYANLPVSVSQVMVNEGPALPFFSGSSGSLESMRLYEALRGG